MALHYTLYPFRAKLPQKESVWGGALGEKARTQSSSRLFQTGLLPNGTQALCLYHIHIQPGPFPSRKGWRKRQRSLTLVPKGIWKKQFKLQTRNPVCRAGQGTPNTLKINWFTSWEVEERQNQCLIWEFCTEADSSAASVLDSAEWPFQECDWYTKMGVWGVSLCPTGSYSHP